MPPDADPEPDSAHWARVAADWIAWARRPGHDAFWYYRPALARVIGLGRGPALDVGCGEGRVSRLLRELGHRVTAADAVPAMVEAARAADSADAYSVAPASAMPFANGAFELVVAYNLLMDVDDLTGTLAELRRVLRDRGRLVVSLVHPLRDRGGFRDGRFAVDGDWFATERFADREERDGLAVDFAGWMRPLPEYVAMLVGAGFAVTALHEPRPEPAPGTGALPDRLGDALRVPIFLWIEAVPR